MKRLYLCYDLSHATALTRLVLKLDGELVIVINPNSGPIAPDAKRWVELMQDLESTRRAHNPALKITWLGYLDLIPEGRLPALTTAKARALAGIYSRDYRAKVTGKRQADNYSVTIKGVWCDDTAADRRADLAPVLAALKADGLRVWTNPGERLPASHWLYDASDAVCVFEGNDEALCDRLGEPPQHPRAVMILSASSERHAEALWSRAKALKLAACALVWDVDYQRPNPWGF